MRFCDVIGQNELVRQLERLAHERRIPHAMLLTGVVGCGKLPLALSLAQTLMGTTGDGSERNNVVQSADLADRYIHPDLHFVFPVRKKSGTTISDMYLKEWREQLERTPYFDFADWMDDMGCEREQPIIYEAESAEILRKLSMKSSMGGSKILVITWPERMNDVCANKLLKLIEEPPADTYIIMVSDEPERLLPTILSRTQIVRVPPVDDSDIAMMLMRRFELDEKMARDMAHLAQGSVTTAIRMMNTDDDSTLYLDLFILLMRKAYQRDVHHLQQWAWQLADMSRERQKAFLQFAGRFVRENFMYNFHRKPLSYLSHDEESFSEKFACFINERNVVLIMQELEQAERDITQNVNSKMVFFDFAMQIIVLLMRK